MPFVLRGRGAQERYSLNQRCAHGGTYTSGRFLWPRRPVVRPVGLNGSAGYWATISARQPLLHAWSFKGRSMFRVRPTAATRANTAPAPCLTRIDARPGRSDTSKGLWDARNNFGGEIFRPSPRKCCLHEAGKEPRIAPPGVPEGRGMGPLGRSRISVLGPHSVIQ